MAATYLALLRGVNVGGKNKLSMEALGAAFVAAGCSDVRTYIQSGNVIFRADPGDASEVPRLVSERIAQSFGFGPPVVLRSLEQLREVASQNPFLHAGADEGTLHVYFLADTPDPRRVDALDPDRSPPVAFVVRGREIYLQLPNGMARTKLTNAYFDSKLATTSTARNWRTVTTLLRLMEG